MREQQRGMKAPREAERGGHEGTATREGVTVRHEGEPLYGLRDKSFASIK